jgi:hypothetical protein
LGERGMAARLVLAFEDLNRIGMFAVQFKG